MRLEGTFDANRSPHLQIPMPRGALLDVVVDTGFNGSLCLPRGLLRKLGFRWIGTRLVELADGSRVVSQLYEGEILWFGQRRTVTALATRSAEGLLGTEMLHDVRLEMDLDENWVRLTWK